MESLPLFGGHAKTRRRQNRNARSHEHKIGVSKNGMIQTPTSNSDLFKNRH